VVSGLRRPSKEATVAQLCPVVLEVTRDIELVQNLTDDDPDKLVYKANWLIARRTVIPMERDTKEHRSDAFRRLQEARATLPDDDRYSQALQRVHGRLIAGVTTKASRTPGGPSEDVHPAELTRVELGSVDAVDKRTKTVSLYDVRINAWEYIENMKGKVPGLANAPSEDEPKETSEHSLQRLEKWDCTGDPVPKLVDWARSRWGDDLENLPNRQDLLAIFREQFGHVHGINENSMREVRRRLAPDEARRGGARMHRRNERK